MYPGRVKDKNSDGTLDIKYDDGFKEKNVEMNRVKILKDKKDKDEAMKAAKPRDDPACKLQEFLTKLQGQLKNLNYLTSQWLTAQRAKIAGNKKPPPRPRVPAAPQGLPLNISEDDSDDLEKLKQDLAEREEYIKELEQRVAENNEALQKLSPTTPAPPAGLSPVDDLISQYNANITERDSRIEELLQHIRAQEDELAHIGAGQISLKDIDDAVSALEKDVEEAKRKRDEVNKDGSLDPELRAVIDAIIEAFTEMRTKVDNLIALQAKAKADREKAAREADEAAEAARKNAEAEGKDGEEAAAAAAAKAERESEEKVKKADLEAMMAAQEVATEMGDAEKGATKLDTGLHPHGAKWWRYRYEHSHIEALIMIFISFLMLLWSVLVRNLKHQVHIWALAPGEELKTELEEIEKDTHGHAYVLWLQLLAEQMMVCILVFLTVWLIAKTPLADSVPVIITSSSMDIRVPNTGDVYRHLAIDCCTIFFFAIMFYFGLIFSVAHHTSDMTNKLKDLEISQSPLTSPFTMTGTASLTSSGKMFELLRRHFITHMSHEITTSTWGSMPQQLGRLIGDDLATFPIWKYLRIEVRASVVQLFHFGWIMWLPVICLFVVFMCLHRFAHMSYVRIIGFFGLVALLIIVGMSWYCKSITRMIQKEEPPEPGPKKRSIHNELPTECIFLGALQFALFVICYGVARMICQSWLWELHFWLVTCSTLGAISCAFLFVYLVSPTIPNFLALQAIPPYVDDDNLKVMIHIAKVQKATGC